MDMYLKAIWNFNNE